MSMASVKTASHIVERAPALIIAVAVVILIGAGAGLLDAGQKGLELIFSDGFESGDTSAWSETVPPPGCTMLFDDAYAQFGQGSEPEWFYGPFGVTFYNSWGYGVIGGMSNGNPGG